jgi:hypothetical protein
VIYNQDDIVAGLAAAGGPRRFQKNITAAKAAGSFQGGWIATGSPGPGATAPAYTVGSGYTCSAATVGALPYVNGAVQNWIALAGGAAALRGTIFIYDRLWSCSGMGFAASTYTVTTPGALPARITDGGVDCELWVEQFVAAGAATGTLTVNYLDTTGAAGVSVLNPVVSAPLIGQMQRMPLAAGDLGISQITNAINSATWTSGSFGLTIMKQVAAIPVSIVGTMNIVDWSQCLAQTPPDACLQIVWQAETTTAAFVAGLYGIIDK